MLTELRLTNFKAFGETQRIPIKPLTLIFGANSSGKSSIIHSLLLANHGSESGSFDVHSPRLAGRMVDLGGFRNYIHGHDLNRMASLHFESRINFTQLRPALIGTNDEESAAFSCFSRFGLALRWSASARVEQMDMHLDGHAVASFTRLENGEYRCEPLPGFFDSLAHERHRLMELAHWKNWAKENSFNLYSHIPLDTPVSPEEKRYCDDKWAEYVRIRSDHRDTFKPSPENLERFAKVLEWAAKEGNYKMEGMVLNNHWPKDLPSASCQGQVIELEFCGGLYENFVEFLGGGDFDDHLSSTYWPAAHALLFSFMNLVQISSTQIAELVKKLGYLGPLRQIPSRYFTETVNEQMEANLGSHVWAQLANQPELMEYVNRWLTDLLGCQCKLEIRWLLDEAGRERGVFPEFLDLKSQTTLSHRDLGFGMSQVIPVLVEAAANKNRLIAVEQPELHLHPAQQAELGDVFIESALGERKNTFLLETHSEHLILRILRRIRETTEGNNTGLPPIQPKDVSVLYVQRGSSGAEVVELPVTPDGDLTARGQEAFSRNDSRNCHDLRVCR